MAEGYTSSEGGSTSRRALDESGKLYTQMKSHIATNGQLDRHGFPRPGGAANRAHFLESEWLNITKVSPCKSNEFNNSTHKKCRRCKKDFTIETPDRVTGGQCTYHHGRCWNNIWKCCGKQEGSRGCTTAGTHVHDDNMRDPSGYVTTVIKPTPENGNPGMYAIDCEMSYTINGLELTSVCIVDHNLKTVYHSYVKPDSRMLDYNTIHSGVTERDLQGVSTTLKDVQNFMLETFSKDTILIGHSLESDFVALKLIHETVVDTSLMYPHPRGLPFKSALRTLAEKHLRLYIQRGTHDSKEDAVACMKLAIAKVRRQSFSSGRGSSARGGRNRGLENFLLDFF
uniref:RNA exonuclease 1 homolog n=1 Tax=Styela clava TaxID=7725 RepID=UPI00193A31E2|nr:RNA exonuclease 1 homolog [Styela clava]